MTVDLEAARRLAAATEIVERVPGMTSGFAGAADTIYALADEVELLQRQAKEDFVEYHDVLKAAIKERERAEAELARLREAVDRLLKEYKKEEDKHGFPFNFALRAAHRDLRFLDQPEGDWSVGDEWKRFLPEEKE